MSAPFKTPLRVDSGRQFPWFAIDANGEVIAVGGRDHLHALVQAANLVERMRQALRVANGSDDEPSGLGDILNELLREAETREGAMKTKSKIWHKCASTSQMPCSAKVSRKGEYET